MKSSAIVMFFLSALSLLGTVTVLTPNGGESWKKGLTYEITWTDDITEDVKIELYQNETLHSEIIASTASDGSYSWTIPLNTFGENFKVKISSTVMPALHSDLSDNYFSIQAGTIQVTSPNGGESYQRGDVISISWTDDIDENVKIELFQNDIYNITITDSTESDGVFSWSIPLTIYGNFKIKITSTSGSEINDYSDSTFEIKQGVISITYPNGSEQLERSSLCQITWNSEYISENVAISLFKNGSFSSMINSNTENDGFYEWSVPSNIFGYDFKIKISSVSSSDINDYSNNYFTIKKGSVTIGSPSGGQVIDMYSDYEIQWTDDFPEDVIISLYKSTTLLSSFKVPSTGKHVWNFYTKDLTAGSNFKLKISSSLYNDVYGETSYFQIKGTNNVKGSLSGEWIDSYSPYIVTDSIYIIDGNKLNIGTNVNVKSYEDNKFTILGELYSNGTADKNINYYDLEMVCLNNNSSDSSKIKYSNFYSNYSLHGAKLYTKGSKCNSVQQTRDGGYILAGEKYNESNDLSYVYLLKTTSSGVISWERTYGGTLYDAAYTVQQTTDDGYIIAGRKNNGTRNTNYLLKVDTSGNTVWEKTYDLNVGTGVFSTSTGVSAKQTPDGGYIFLCQKTTTTSATLSDSRPYLIKTTSTGTISWEYDYDNIERTSGKDIVLTSDGGYAITGTVRTPYDTPDRKNDLVIFKVTSTGNVSWEREFGGYYNDFGYSLNVTSDNEFIIVGQKGSSSKSDIYLVKTSSSGGLIWEKTLESAASSSGNSVSQTSDGGFIIAGSTNSTGAGGFDVTLQKTNQDGNLIWSRTYGATQNDYGYSLDQTDDGGFIIGGSIMSDEYKDFTYCVKTNSSGVVIDSLDVLKLTNGTNATIQNCKFQNSNGCGILVDNSNPIFTNNVVTGCRNGVILKNSSSQFISNNTIFSNDSIGIIFDKNSDALLINNIIYNNSISQISIKDDLADPNFYYNDIQNGQSGIILNSGVSYTGSYSNNLESDPQFLPDSYLLSESSPCKDTGYPGLSPALLNALNIPQTDILGNPRLHGDIDMGVHEYGSVGIDEDNIVNKLELYQNYPNPFNPFTTINYSLAEYSHVSLRIYDIKGSEVFSLVDKVQDKGLHSVKFDAEKLSSGIYFYRLKVNNQIIANKKMMLLK